MKKITGILTLLCFLFVTLLNPFSFAWMSDNGMSSPIDITSNVHKTYFKSGNGSKETPYVIATPLQLYYFAWLQDLGLFNTPTGENDKIDTVYFVLEDNIDMSGYPIPAIGTQEHPFLGNFDGNGKTISNLTVENKLKDLYEPPKGSDEFENYAEIIGFFGVVGELTDNTYNYEKSTNEVKNVILSNLTIRTQTTSALVGFAAGYVNGVVDCVGIVDSRVDIKQGTNALTSYTNSLSNYALIGYCTEKYRNDVYIMNVDLRLPGTSEKVNVPIQGSPDGDENAWGGSVKMSEIFNWLDDISTSNKATSTSEYIKERTDVITLDKKTVTVTEANTPASKSIYSVTDYETNVAFGSFIISNRMNFNGSIINFLGGAQKVTKYEYSLSNETETVYNIKDGNYYLNFDGSTISSTTNQTNATKWYVSTEWTDGSTYNIYTIDETTNRIYYLTISGSNITTIREIDVDPANLPEWEFSNGKLSFDDKPIICNNGTWQIAQPSGYKLLSNSRYLDNNGTTIQAESNVDNATTWTINTSGNSTTISTIIDGTPHYLAITATDNNNASLSLVPNTTSTTTSTTNWTYNATNGRFSASLRPSNSNRNRTYYLQYRTNNSRWVGYSSNASITLVEAYDSDFDVSLVSSGTAEKLLREKVEESVDNALKNSYYDENGVKQETDLPGITYFPLSSDVDSSGYSAAKTNTGYIIGAEYGDLDKGEVDGDGSNLRISSYSTSSMTESTTPYTISYKSSVFKTISNTESSTLASLGLQKYADCYGNYTDSIKNELCGLHFMEASVTKSNTARITAQLRGKDPIPNYEVPTNCIDFNLYDQGFINFFAGSYYTQNGGNNSFFSIYEITREPDDNTTIKEIKEIRMVYGKLNGDNINTNEPYRYVYIKDVKDFKATDPGVTVDANGNIVSIVDVYGNNVVVDSNNDKKLDENDNVVVDDSGKIVNMIENEKGALVLDNPYESAGYEMIFDCRWITHPDDSSFYGTDSTIGPTRWPPENERAEEKGKAFYFEVPVNEGEYAIGSTEGRVGAYLVYLDLAANAQYVERDKTQETIVEECTDASIPIGDVDMLLPSESGYDTSDINSPDSMFVTINTNASGVIDFDRTGENELTLSTLNGVTAEYVGEDGVITNGVIVDGQKTELSVPVTKTTTIERTTYRDYNPATKESTVTVITKTTVIEGDTKKITYEKTVTVTDENGDRIEDKCYSVKPQSDPLTPDLADEIEDPGVGDPLINLAFTYKQQAVKQETGGEESPEEETPPAIVTYLFTPSTKTYLITIINNTDTGITVKATLTAAGLTAQQKGYVFLISDGTNQTTIENAVQKVEIAGIPEEEPNEQA